MDSVAGLDMICNSDSTAEGQETIRKSNNAPGVMTTNAHRTAGATAHVYYLDTFIEVQRLKKSHAVRSQENGSKKTVICMMGNQISHHIHLSIGE